MCPATWKRNQAYKRGETVYYDGHKWYANQWNYNEVPGGASGAWDDRGRCW